MFDSLRRTRRLVLKELAVNLGTPKMRAVLIFPPIMQLIMFAYAVSLEVTNVRLGVFNMDSGAESSTFLQSFGVKPVFRDVLYYRSYEDLKDALERREIFAGLSIPNDFSSRMLSVGESAKVQLLLDGRRANASAILGGYVAQITQSYGVKAAIQTPDGGNVSMGPIARRWFNPNLISRNSFMPGLICLITTTVGLMVSSFSIAREREMGTFEQLIVSPATPTEIVAGKTISSVLLATCSALLSTAIVIFGFKIPLQGTFALFLACTVLYLTSIVSVGLMISSAATTQQQAMLGVFLFMPPAMILSGFATPIDNMPEWLKTATIANPVRWEMEVMKGLFLRGASNDAIGACLVPLAVVAVISLVAAGFMFKRRME
ncbi:MAG: ABC transporter permease [Thermoguttaceae bacterium]|nr:ABC transporter permease [Thermoguttaceae bacterium]MBR5760304.1 ABC transporter permease [Thermoguttaceae bacterium]